MEWSTLLSFTLPLYQMQPKQVPLHQFPLDKHCVLVLTFVLVKVHHLNSNYNLTSVHKAYIRCDLFRQGSF